MPSYWQVLLSLWIQHGPSLLETIAGIILVNILPSSSPFIITLLSSQFPDEHQFPSTFELMSDWSFEDVKGFAKQDEPSRLAWPPQLVLSGWAYVRDNLSSNLATQNLERECLWKHSLSGSVFHIIELLFTKLSWRCLFQSVLLNVPVVRRGKPQFRNLMQLRVLLCHCHVLGSLPLPNPKLTLS